MLCQRQRRTKSVSLSKPRTVTSTSSLSRAPQQDQGGRQRAPDALETVLYPRVMLQFGHTAPGSASAQPASLGPCFGNILKGKRLRRNGGSHKWSTAAHHLFGYETEVRDACTEQLLGLLISRVVALRGCSPQVTFCTSTREWGQHLQTKPACLLEAAPSDTHIMLATQRAALICTSAGSVCIQLLLQSPDIEADELEAAGALFSLAAMAAEMEPAQPEDSGGYVPPARRKGGRGEHFYAVPVALSGPV